jgi:hypothetical protein
MRRRDQQSTRWWYAILLEGSYGRDRRPHTSHAVGKIQKGSGRKILLPTVGTYDRLGTKLSHLVLRENHFVKRPVSVHWVHVQKHVGRKEDVNQ